ncbi:hypothetical protein, partial [uncultured Caballeronia sp.]|uniref:hypothetical protein n=1 Tax=uncultured Caballeronia sp. TaxID=1827198 RepID=UPI0035CC194F
SLSIIQIEPAGNGRVSSSTCRCTRHSKQLRAEALELENRRLSAMLTVKYSNSWLRTPTTGSGLAASVQWICGNYCCRQTPEKFVTRCINLLLVRLT